jgi:hypothetical protein
LFSLGMTAVKGRERGRGRKEGGEGNVRHTGTKGGGRWDNRREEAGHKHRNTY